MSSALSCPFQLYLLPLLQHLFNIFVFAEAVPLQGLLFLTSAQSVRTGNSLTCSPMTSRRMVESISRRAHPHTHIALVRYPCMDHEFSQGQDTRLYPLLVVPSRVNKLNRERGGKYNTMSPLLSNYPAMSALRKVPGDPDFSLLRPRYANDEQLDQPFGVC